MGCFFVYIACFLTESEEHEIVDHLSTWWITIKDRQQAAESGLAAFLAGITGFTSFVLDRLFGQKLLTTRVAMQLPPIAFVFLIALHVVPKVVARARPFRRQRPGLTPE